jgi:hypothetical protein
MHSRASVTKRARVAQAITRARIVVDVTSASRLTCLDEDIALLLLQFLAGSDDNDTGGLMRAPRNILNLLSVSRSCSRRFNHVFLAARFTRWLIHPLRKALAFLNRQPPKEVLSRCSQCSCLCEFDVSQQLKSCEQPNTESAEDADEAAAAKERKLGVKRWTRHNKPSNFGAYEVLCCVNPLRKHVYGKPHAKEDQHTPNNSRRLPGSIVYDTLVPAVQLCVQALNELLRVREANRPLKLNVAQCLASYRSVARSLVHCFVKANVDPSFFNLPVDFMKL